MRSPAGELVFDATGRLAGRGAYLCADGACWATALRKGALQRALAVPLPAELRERLAAGPSSLNPTPTEGGHRGS